MSMVDVRRKSPRVPDTIVASLCIDVHRRVPAELDRRQRYVPKTDPWVDDRAKILGDGRSGASQVEVADERYRCVVRTIASLKHPLSVFELDLRDTRFLIE